MSVKNFLIENTEKLVEILQNADFHHITLNKNELRFANSVDGNKTGIRLKIDTLSVNDFIRGINGDIYTLLMHKLRKDFKDTCKWLEAQLNGCNIVERIPFCSGFYNNFLNYNTHNNEEVYNIDDLYSFKANKRFLNDNISIETQIKYRIGYDFVTNRIVIPYITEKGVVGVMGRLNEDVVPDDIPKYLALIPFARSNYLYGFENNYSSIIEKNIVFVFESEKAVLQMDTYGINCSVAVGKHSISPKQIDLLKSLNSRIVICFDEGISEEEIRVECEKFKSGLFGKVDIAYIFDRDNKYLPKGSKTSPSDLDCDIFKRLAKECLIVYKEE